ncbi:MAG: hypothetical protein HC912_02320 [Saprospiraceae bacterium]|nr:hypothetical protein [Saprospiraceae bacterium]
MTYKILHSAQQVALLQIHPSTGKFHQIRAQLAAMNCPILGDVKYGSTQKYVLHAIALHAFHWNLMSRLQKIHRKLSLFPRRINGGNC